MVNGSALKVEIYLGLEKKVGAKPKRRRRSSEPNAVRFRALPTASLLACGADGCTQATILSSHVKRRGKKEGKTPSFT